MDFRFHSCGPGEKQQNIEEPLFLTEKETTMNQDEQGKENEPIVPLVIPAKPTDLSDADLDKVAGGRIPLPTGPIPIPYPNTST